MRAALSVLLLLALPVLAAADTHPNAAGGFAPGQPFQAGEIDNVNLFNGNLVLTIPIGQAYPVGGGLSYGLTLVYNSTPWQFQQRHDSIKNVDYNQAWPNPLSNAGLGWQLSPGRLLAPGANAGGVPVNDSVRWIYRGPDGGEHVFYDTLHSGDNKQSGVSYTRDGSYLRMKVVGVAREIEFPDGTIHRFDSTGRLVQMKNRFSANLVSITYTQPWTISDNHGRTQKIYFQTLSQDGGNVEVVQKVELTAFGGTTATYTFGYAAATIRRPCPHNEDPAVLSETVQVQLLTSLTLPDGSSYSMPAADYVTDAPATGPLCRGSGSIRGLTLPTLGKLAWDYVEYGFPSPSASRPYREVRAGVGARKVFDASDVLLGQWTYATSLTASPLHPIREEMVNSVTDPLGNRRDHYFSVFTGGAFSTFQKEDYSLPFSRNTGDGDGRFLSTQVYNAAGTLLRSTYVRYQRDQSSEVLGFQDELNVNRREETSRTVYHDDGDRYTQVSRSGFDGLGHFRQTTSGGSFASGDTRSGFVNFNPDRGTYQLDANGIPQAGFSMLPSDSPWILGTFTEQTVTEGSSIDHTVFCFDAATGFLKRRRMLKSSPSLLADDVLAVFTADAAGNVASESWHGADAGGLSQTDTCGFNPPAADYQLNHAYTAGVLATSQYTGAGFHSVRQDIDVQSGLVKASYDTAGLKTEYEYESLGRPSWVKPAAGHGAWTEYLYNRATSSSSLATVIVRKRANGSKAGSVIVPAQVHFDALGRVWKELSFLPGNIWSIRETHYNGAGWKSQVSEPYPLTNPPTVPTSWTKLLEYDPFGRAKTIRPPDGQNHDVTINHYGVRVVDRTVKVGTAWSGGAVTEASAKTTEVYDHHGRLEKVTEPSGANETNVTTTYDYDAGNRLVHVKTTAPVSGSSLTQNRWFNYDGRGFLVSEIHPEKGISGNGRVDYSGYDARGHAGRIVDGGNDLSYTYDFAERLTGVWETGGRQLKQYVWDTAAGWGNGKLAQSDRFNYPVLGTTTHTVLITEAYGYGGTDGRVSQRNTRLIFNGGQAELFTQTFGWTQLGDVATLGYPQCAHAGCTVPSPRTVTNGYANSVLSSVSSGGVTYGTINYHVNGMVDQVAHANGVTDTQALDAWSMRRPGSITSASGGATRWTTGAYTYDGAGNIKQIGTSWFTYDKVSRMTTGTVYTGPTGAGTQKQQTYTFDPFGNLTSIGGTSGRSVPIDPSTNRQNATGVTYDAAGNLTSWNGNTYQYDPFNNMWRMKSGAEEWLYVYTADGERVWSFKVGSNYSRWTLRDLSGQVLREYMNNQGTWSLAEDYLYRDGLLLAAETPAGRRHFHLDHLGTPRLITDAAAAQVAYHVYYPFGEEATAFNQDAERMKFTGHERDLASLAGAGDDLDYMHARHYSPVTGRFLSPDPEDSAKRSQPQSWNKYHYTLNNPLRYVDPNGQAEREGAMAGVVINNSGEVIWVAGDVDGKTVVIPLQPGESSAMYFQDADAIVIDPGTVSPEGAELGPSVEGEDGGAFKIGASEIVVEGSGPMNLGLDRTSGYAASWLIGRAGFLDVKEAQRLGWVVPDDRTAAEKKKEELRRMREDREKEKKEKKEKNPSTAPSRKGET